MDAFKGSYTRTSADQYEEFLKVRQILFMSATISRIWCIFYSGFWIAGFELNKGNNTRPWTWASFWERRPRYPPPRWTSLRRLVHGTSRLPPLSRPWSSSSRYNNNPENTTDSPFDLSQLLSIEYWLLHPTTLQPYNGPYNISKIFPLRCTCAINLLML